VRQHLGHDPATAEALLNIHAHLHHGGRVEDKHVRLLQQAHPGIGNIPALVDALNAEPPGMRPRMYLAMLSGDMNVLHDRMHEAGDTYKALDKLATTFHAESIADELHRRADGGKLKPEPAQRPVDPMSTRAIIEAQLEPPGMRAMAKAIDDGDPHAVHTVRHYLADKIDACTDVLKPESEASPRESITAAFDYHGAVEAAQDEGWLPGDE
jgi:hypothetical protein